MTFLFVVDASYQKLMYWDLSYRHICCGVATSIVLCSVIGSPVVAALRSPRRYKFLYILLDKGNVVVVLLYIVPFLYAFLFYVGDDSASDVASALLEHCWL